MSQYFNVSCILMSQLYTHMYFNVSATGGMSKLTSNFYRHLAERLSEKKQMPYSVAMGLIRCRLCFALLRAAIMCIRGARSSKQNPIFNSPFELQVAEGHLVI